ncbi:galactokinase family protein [Alkalibacterium sp. MB6]|uniref:galactokinase family protein n=1 Tax=Alkalibacterium sp. MB6 TaxID=2081965 RepID=UPI0013793EE3|nr:galactokinase family protein [Alkalibacterium sp. MB6]
MKEIVEQFKKEYRLEDIRAVKSPLRICPIGAHSDHQLGKVTGMTLDSSVDFVYTPSLYGYIKVQSLDFPDKEWFHIDHEMEYVPGFWGTYLRGAKQAL